MPAGSKKAPKTKRTEKISVRPSSGNVYEDLGVSESPEALAKAELAARISKSLGPLRTPVTKFAPRVFARFSRRSRPAQ